VGIQRDREQPEEQRKSPDRFLCSSGFCLFLCTPSSKCLLKAESQRKKERGRG
jgi:hypothetical protein